MKYLLCSVSRLDGVSWWPFSESSGAPPFPPVDSVCIATVIPSQVFTVGDGAVILEPVPRNLFIPPGYVVVLGPVGVLVIINTVLGRERRAAVLAQTVPDFHGSKARA